MPFKSKNALKNEVQRFKAELRKTQGQLTKAKDSLATSRMFEQFYHGKYELYKHKCEELEGVIEALKKENRELKIANKAMKAVQIAHQNYRKEA